MPGACITNGERVTLRTVEEEDVPFVQRALANREIRHPMGNPVMNRRQLADHLEEDGADRFLVCLEDEWERDGTDANAETAATGDDGRDVTRIGQVNVTDADYKRPELGYWLVPTVHGEGYGTESVSLAIDYAFRTYDAPAVGAEAYDFNDASRGLLESLGFTEEGRRRKYMFVDGAHRDMVQYGLLREEWREGKPESERGRA
ncbi:GNAT family protein [Haladaptatus sp. DYF46]|uniref:GNAT family N-acetyltransferase n=1 Tax=Haladaptatus sp. DYF46 TaxID=2886041 RepID=UPI001E555951|nr:GNAT family protein [Haladaptatus sp. DYF46]